MEDKGYTVDTSRKYVKVKPQGKDRFVRLKSLSSGYDEQSLKDKILESLRSKVIIKNVESTQNTIKKPLRQLLKEDIYNVISQSISFEDFLKRIQVDYTINLGTHISFRKDSYGQSFIRSSVLGVDYDKEHIKQRIEQVNISEMYLKLADMPMNKMIILDTINKQKAEVILAKYGIDNKQEFIERLKILEDVKHNYNIFQRELESTSRKYSKLINDYHKVQSQESINKNNLKKKRRPL